MYNMFAKSLLEWPVLFIVYSIGNYVSDYNNFVFETFLAPVPGAT